MKLNIIQEGGQKMSGFINVSDDWSRTADDEIEFCRLGNLDPIVDDGEAQYILARDIVNYLRQDELFESLSHWISKLSHGGVICIGSADINEVCRMIYNGEISGQDIGDVLYGSGENIKKSSMWSDLLIDFLRSKGLKILKARLERYHLIVEAQRL